jgi:hypothetical protein
MIGIVEDVMTQDVSGPTAPLQHEEAAACTPPTEGEVTLFTSEEQRLMYLFPRIPFPPSCLNGLQSTYLDQVVAWGWYALRDDGMYAPTALFLARFTATHQARIEQCLAAEAARKQEH